MQMFTNAVGQGIGNGGDITKINLVEVSASGFNGLAPLAVGSTFNFSYNSVFGSDNVINSTDKALTNFVVGGFVNGVNNKVQLPKSVMTDASFMTYQGMINTSTNAIGTAVINQ